VIVLRVADAGEVVRGELGQVERRGEPGPLGHAARQEHQRALVEDERALDAGLADRRQRGVGVGGRRREDRGADLERHAVPPERLDQRGLGRISEAAHCALLREVGEAAVLRDDEVEEAVDVRTHALEIVEHAAGDEKQPAAGFADAREHGRGLGGQTSVVGDRPVVVARDHVNDHPDLTVARYKSFPE
jgi:hypothetical protein